MRDDRPIRGNRPAPHTHVWMRDTGAPAVVQLYDQCSASGTFPVRRQDRPGWETTVLDAVSLVPIPEQAVQKTPS